MTERKDVPFVCPIEGGGIQLEWTKEGKHLELEFSLDGEIVWLTEEGDDMEAGECKIDDYNKIKELFAWYEQD